MIKLNRFSTDLQVHREEMKNKENPNATDFLRKCCPKNEAYL
jgi:hypothetical protein